MIKRLILEFAGTVHYDVIKVGMESTSAYSFHPVIFLAEDVDVKKLGIEVIVQNPRDIARFKSLFEEDKTDRIDARRIARFPASWPAW